MNKYKRLDDDYSAINKSTDYFREIELNDDELKLITEEINKPVEELKEIVKMVVTAKLLNVRSSKDLADFDNVITRLNEGSEVELINDEGEWYKVKLSNGTEGYVMKEFVSKIV